MNYTDNYHLPQWEKSDRVLMEDFNQMCSSIDSGISAVQTAANTLAGQVSSNAAAAEAALKRGLFRNAYNRYHAASALEPLPRQLGFFCQELTPEVCGKEGFESLIPRGEDAAWLADGVEYRRDVSFEPYCTSISELSVNYYSEPSSPAVFDFTPDSPGYFYDILLMGTWSAGTRPATAPSYRLTVRNLETGKDEIDQVLQGTYHAGIGEAVWLYGKFYFHKSKYRITVAAATTGYSAKFRLLNGGIFRGHTYASPAATLKNTVEVGETSADGFVSLAYEDYGNVSIQLKWDGRVIAPYTTYTYADSAGRTVKERLWRRGGTVPGTTSLQLDLRCAGGGDLTLYSWGMALI